MSFAYREQTRTNGREAPTYLTYLRKIAHSRRSELLETLVATEYSAGNFDADQINEAYRYFSISPRDEGVSDDLILGTFQARLQDAAKHETDMRGHLKVIGQHRNSQRIKDVAEDGELLLGVPSQITADVETALNTYEQALAFFDADPTVADEFVPTLFTTKVCPPIEGQSRSRLAQFNRPLRNLRKETWLTSGSCRQVKTLH